MAVLRNILVELDMHQAIFFQRMHHARLCLTRLEEAKRLRDWHLVDDDLAMGERRLGNAVAGLDDRCISCPCRRCNIRNLGEKGPDRHRIGGIIGALIDDLEHVVRAQD